MVVTPCARLTIQRGEHESAPEVEHICLRDDVPRDIVLGQGRICPDHVQRWPGAVVADQELAGGTLEIRILDQMACVHAVAVHRGTNKVPNGVATDAPDSGDVYPELGEVDRWRRCSAGHGELDLLEEGQLLAGRH